MCNIKYLIKFVSELSHAEMLMSGKLFMRPAEYYRKLEEGQGDIGEGGIILGTRAYKNSRLPIFCMTAVCSDAILDGRIIISKECVSDFNCQEGFLVLIDHDDFEKWLLTVNRDGYAMHYGQADYRSLTFEDSNRFITEDHGVGNLFIKRPRFSYQNEYRVVIAKSCYKDDEPIKESIIYSSTISMEGFAKIIPVSKLEKSKDNYICDVKCGDKDA